MHDKELHITSSLLLISYESYDDGTIDPRNRFSRKCSSNAYLIVLLCIITHQVFFSVLPLEKTEKGVIKRIKEHNAIANLYAN